MGNTEMFKGQKEIAVPKYTCRSCLNRCDKNCSFFKRYIELDYNRCFYHSHYKPIHAVFKPIENLEQLIAEEEKKYA